MFKVGKGRSTQMGTSGTYRAFGLAVLLLATKIAGSAAILGAPAPDFALPSLSDGNQRISEYRSEVVFISFLTPKCWSCRESIMLANELHEKFGNDGLQVFAISVAEDTSYGQSFVTNFGIEFPMLLDRDSAASSLYSMNESSMTVVLDQEGNIVFMEEGFRQNSAKQIVALIADLVAD
jgi:peroxiredoxin